MNNCEDMNSKEREAMKLALAALTIQSDRVTEIGKKREAITAIKEALANHIEDNLTMVAQPEQELGVKGYAMALNEVALKLRKRYEHDLLSTPLWLEFEKTRNKFARSIATPNSQPEQVGINGLTEAETNATASVFGLVSTTPQQRKPLTDEQRLAIQEQQKFPPMCDPYMYWFFKGVDACEAAHGIKEKNT